MAAEITFIRHGQTTGNAEGRWQGHTNSPLTDLGRAQAEKLAARLAKVEYDLVVASDLDRTVQTAAVLGHPVETDPRWREPFFGDWENLATSEIMARDPENLAALFRGEDIAVGGGELLSHVFHRTSEALADVVDRVGDGAAAIVSHGMSLLTLLSTMLGTKRPSPLRLLGNSSTATVRIDGDDFTILRYNDDTHLGHTALPHFGSSPTDTEMLLIRHGRTTSNVEGRWQGQTDGQLSDEGRRQAKLLGASLPPLDALYSSPLARAADTATAIAENQDVEIVTDDDLQEIGFGAWEGMTREEISTAFPEEFADFARGVDVPRGGDGETFAGVRERMAGALDRIVARHPGNTVGVVSHGGATRAYVTDILGLGHQDKNRLGLLGNTAYARMAYTWRGPTLVSWNLTPHLAD